MAYREREREREREEKKKRLEKTLYSNPNKLPNNIKRILVSK
jgi:hypothetical protein